MGSRVYVILTKCIVQIVVWLPMQVRKCSLLPTVLKVSLAVGNFLNAGNRNGAAAGFKLDALLKFKDVRSTGGRFVH
jgi:Formin Homology 2 Domain